MVNRHQQTEHKTTSETFRLRRLSAGIRMAIAGGVLISSVSPVLAEVPAAQVWAAMGGAAALSQAMPPLPQAFDDATAGVTDQLEGANKLNINLKDKDRAILNWKSFNVNTGKEVQFHQKDGSSIALNRIFQENPSQILGKVTANGQIYLYNQNGFVFGKDATVNTNTLVASTLNISDEAFAGGITQQNNISIDKPAFGPEDDKPETATKVDSFIQVEQGAKIHATSNGGKDGNDGLIIMAAPTIENKGSISTDQYGQIILVASEDKVYLQPTDNNSPFSGLLVEVDTGGKVSNLGEILTREGNVTLQGFAVNQGGRITATTSINENGSIRLLAQERHRNSSGKLLATQTVREADLEDGLGTESTVTFTPNSVTQIVADESGGKAIDAQAQPQSYMDIVANKVHLQGADGVNNGAAIVAPGGKVNIVATNELNIIDPVNGNVTLPQTPAVAENAGRVLIEKGATIDVSGTQNVSAEMERNVAEISVQSFELRDSPLQKTGILKGQTVRVDIRKDNQVIDTSGAVNRLERSLEERLGKGGEINITSGGDVLVNDGAVVNISGGSVDYQDGYINTTKLMDQYGQIIDISEADPNERYISIFGVVNEVHEKWGVTKIWNILEQFSQGQFERGYTEGQRAGALNIQTPLLSWNGELIAGTESGRYQRETGKTPFGGSLTLNEKDGQQSEPYYVSQQNVVFQAEKTALQLTIDDEFPRHDDNGESLDDLILSESLINGSGLQSIVVNTSGSATISKDASIAPAFGGPAPTQVDSANPSSVLPLFAGTVNKSGALFSVDATQIDVQGDVYMPGGSLELSTHFDVVANNPGEINLDKTTTIDVSGRWVNDFEKGFTADPIEPLIIDGGSVKLAATGDLSMKAGSVIKADGGAWLALNNELTEGAGGAISLTAATSNAGSSLLHLDGKLSAYGLSEGGSLTLSSGKIVVGSLADAPDDNGVTPLVLGVDNGNFQVAKNSGFGEIHLISNEDDLTISGDTDLRLLAQNRVLASDFRDQSSAQSISGFSDVETLPESLRHAVDLSLTGESGVIMETGAKITGDKESSISLLARSKGGVFVDGVIDAPGGSIELAINADPGNIIYDPAQAVWLGSQAQLLARGTTRLDQPDALGLRSGDVLDGGNVTLAANRGYVVQQQGALIDVSGTHTILDLPVAEAEDNSALGYAATDVGSNAGKINIAAGEGVILNGQMSGFAGSETTRNGSFNLTLDRNLRALDPFAVFPTNPAVIQVSQTRQNNLDETVQYGDALDNFSNDPTSVNDPDSLNGKASISSQLIAESGFEEVRLNSLDEIRFVGDVDLTAKARIDLNTAKITWEADPNSATLDGKVNIDAAFLRIGSELSRDNQNIIDLPIAGAGVLTTVSQWTELVGASRWDGFSEINLNSAHDLRTVGVRPTQGQRDFIGSMTTAANLNLNASQIYPTTLSNFTFTVNKDVNPEGQINITGSNTDASPLSANGSLAFDAPIINQGGVLKAPFGSIKLTAGASLTLGKDSLTSVSGDGKTIPFGVTLGGLAWLYPLSDSDGSLVFNSSPDFNAIQTKQLTFDSPEITLEEGSVVDISGGGDLLAYEFQTGVGGTNDYLAPINATDFGSYQGGFAILPSLGSSLAPSDHSQNAAIAKLPEALQDNFTIGGSVYLSGSESLPAGTYTILPPRYALLPGAYLVTPQANTQDLAVTTYTKDGLPIVPGYQTFAATGTRDARSSGFLIEQGADIRQHSQYDEKTANSFFTELAEKDEINIPLIPNDSGQLLIDVEDRLTLQGSIKSTAFADGRGAKVDISSNNIKVVENVSTEPTADGALEILAGDLNDLNLDSLLLGGVRSRDKVSGETGITVNADQVTFDNGIDLKVKDLLATAKTKVSVNSGATLTASGKVNTGDTVLNVVGDGALLRVSADQQVLLNRTFSSGDSGDLAIAEGATLKGQSAETLQSVLLDASRSTELSGDIVMQGGSLSLNANAINIGEVSDLSSNALDLSNRQLSNLSVDELQLNSRSAISFYGDTGQVDSDGNFIVGADGLITPLQFGSLIINAAGFSGVDNHGKTARIQADSLLVQNPLAAKAASIGSGDGQLDLLTDSYTQGEGNFAVNGFKTVNLNVAHKDGAGQAFNADGASVLNVAADLNLTADYLTASGGADLQINAGGHKVSLNRAGSDVDSGIFAFGGAIGVVADQIDFNTSAILPSGKLTLQALTGDLRIGEQAEVDLAGRAVGFADVVDYTPGGTFSAVAEQGSIQFAAGSALDLSTGGEGAAGGNLILKAPKQSVELSGQLKATGGSAEIDVAGYGSTNSFDGLMTALADAGISESIYFRTREADINQAAGKSIAAKDLTLVADQGNINLSGALNANSAELGGGVQLYAGDNITLQNGSQLTAVGATGKGGNVLLSSVDSDGDGVSGIDIKAGSLINVGGADQSQGGDVTLRALREGKGVNIDSVEGAVTGYSQYDVEAVKKYTNKDIANGQITTSLIAKIKADTDSYMASASINLGDAILRPGVEIDYSGNLLLKDQWNFIDWRYDGAPGNLVIKSQGKLTLENAITDGFAASNLFFGDTIQSGQSWSYQLTSGADLTSADSFATLAANAADVKSGARDLVIGSTVREVFVRTGTGDIKLGAGGNVVFKNQFATVYNAGKPEDSNPYGTLSDYTIANYLNADYPIEGGDITIKAGHNIQGAVSDQFISNLFGISWLPRIGNWGSSSSDLAFFPDSKTPTAWGVDFTDYFGNQSFQQNIGSFGGGNVNISAAGNISNLSVMMPTTGKQVGKPYEDGSNNAISDLPNFLTNEIQINGGGQLQVNAGGDIAGGAYYLGKGDGSIAAGGEIKGGAQFANGPQLLMGDSRLDLTARQGVSLTAVADAMVLSSTTKFFSYTPTSGITVKSLAGDVNLGADTSVITDPFILNLTTINDKVLSTVYPASLQATAFGGSIGLGAINLFPSSSNQLNLLAKDDIASLPNISGTISMRDVDLSLLPTALTPKTSFAVDDIFTLLTRPLLSTLPIPVPVMHGDDKDPARLVTQEGDINQIGIGLSKRGIVQAGRDLRNLQIAIQNINPDDVSILSAGRDIRNDIQVDSIGFLKGLNAANAPYIQVAGPGDVLVKSGRNIDLGAANGIVTVGNDRNPNLPDNGANLDVLVGLNTNSPDYMGFVDYLDDPQNAERFAQYQDELSQVKTLLTGFMRTRTGDAALSEAAALAAFRELDANESLPIQPQLNALLSQVFFNEIKLAGSASAGDSSLGNEGGFKAIETLFPGAEWQGDLNMIFSTLQTTQGGDINLMAPGGQVNVGLSFAFPGLTKSSSELGIIAQEEGSINVFVHDDFKVNQSRVFTQGGGDILIWSSEGDIDAGRGAKSALSVPETLVTFKDEKKQTIIKPAVSGSGIRTAAGLAQDSGDAFLFAPKGVVDAGEAGIGATNVTISATAVLGANNIQVGGVGTGVPAASTGSLAAGLTGVSNLNANVSQVAQTSADMSEDAKDANSKNVALGVLSVDVLGYGDCQSGDSQGCKN